MNIPNPRILKESASHALSRGREPRKVIQAYAGITLLLGLLVAAGDWFLSQRLADTSGLSGMDQNTLLSTLQLTLPVVQMLALICLDFGYLHAMMRIARGQYADHTDLKEGFRRFGPILRATVLEYLLLFVLGFALLYPCILIFMVMPFSVPFWQLATELDPSAMTAMVLDEATTAALTRSMIPLFIMFFGFFYIAAAPLLYHLRLTRYILLDQRCGAIRAMLTSFRLMRRNCFRFLKVDLSLWWYHLPVFLLGLLPSCSLLLPYLDITLPWPADLSYYLLYGISLLGTSAVYYLARNKVALTYVKAYDSLRPPVPRTGGVVLGNIFQM